MMQQQMMGNGGGGREAQGGGGEESNPFIAMDSGMAQMSQSFSKLPGGEELAKRMEGIRAEFRDVVSQAMQLGSGGGAAGGPRPQPQRAQPVPDRSQGTPAGMY